MKQLYIGHSDRVDLIIDGDLYSELVEEGHRKDNSPFVQETKMGCILSGKMQLKNKSLKYQFAVTNFDRFWKLGEIETLSSPSVTGVCRVIFELLPKMQALLICISLLALTAGRHIQDIHSGPKSTNAENLRNSNIGDILTAGKVSPPHEQNKEYWYNVAREQLQQRIRTNLNTNEAKNVIFFLGDGMSLTTVTSARILKGQLQGRPGEEEQLSFENFPYVGLSKTYCANAQVPDSACTSTAYMCGVKANIVTLGVSARVNYNNCTESMNPENHVSSIVDWAQKAGKSTGFITTTTLTHASPSGSYAHVANRFWECDSDVTKWTGITDSSQCKDIAQQLITQEPGKHFNVLMGGGMGKFLPKHIKDFHGKMGERSDNKNLLSTWQALHPKGVVVTDRQSLLNLDINKLEHIMGLFQPGVMDFHAKANHKKQPSFAEMTEVAIKLLSKNPKGYFIFIEGGLIDYGNHMTNPGLSTSETLEFDKAVQKARAMTNLNDTLIVVSSDHAHPLSMGGFANRGNDILGIDYSFPDANGQYFATLNYALGPNQYLDDKGKRLDLSQFLDNNHWAVHPSYIKSELGVHGGDDVGVYASGPYEHLFRGVIEQHTLPHLMACAAGIGNGRTACSGRKNL
ncbi:alkaline phosphatase-like [Musca vetustissima]|uniref:alkaline phosphatase-like n=1 Tax=Musca vetustissima TaxID=27455 RepID=UPI002AB7C245|nr:alkaline phosphatase-like [Musca vetustissima]